MTGKPDRKKKRKETETFRGIVLQYSRNCDAGGAGAGVPAADGAETVRVSYLYGHQRKYGARDPHRKSGVYPGDGAGGCGGGRRDRFYGAKDSASIITHRVVENRVLMGEFITKGDANQTEDMNPASYENFIGKVVKSYPEIGEIAQILTGPEGKVIAGGVIAAAVVLQILASMFERRYEKRQSRV